MMPIRSVHPLNSLPRGRSFPANHRLPLALRWASRRTDALPVAVDLGRDESVAAVEAVLVVADEPLPPRRIAQVAGLDDPAQARRCLRQLQALYERGDSPFRIEEIAGGFQLQSRAEYHPWLARLRRHGQDLRLSAAARETLAIVAYRQPIMRADIEAVRGVQCGEILRQLMEKGLVRIAGRHESLGRPVLYGTTKKFLQWFGLKNLEELPLAQQMK